MGLRSFLGLKKRARPKKRQRPPRPTTPPLNQEIWRRATQTSADFVEPFLDRALLFREAEDIRRFALEEAPKTGLILEFGVFKGKSINAFAKQLAASADNRPIYGFDAFSGLQEHWTGVGYHQSRNHFNLRGHLPVVESNVKLVPGWIDDTLPGYLAENPGSIAFLHVDTDTYKPAKTILSLCRDRLVPGSVILFDDFLDHPGWHLGEHRALNEEFSPDCYEWRAFCGYRAMLTIL